MAPHHRQQPAPPPILNLPHEPSFSSSSTNSLSPPISQMPFPRKLLLYASSSLPSSPSTDINISGGSPRNSDHNPARSSFTQRRLTRQRKLRHVTDEELFGYGSLPGSPDFDRKIRARSDHWSSHAVPQPLPLPDASLTKRVESTGSHLVQPLPGSPEENHGFVLRRNSADHIPAKSTRCEGNCRSFSHDSKVENSNNYNLRLSIPARTASTSGFSSPPISPRRSNACEFTPHCWPTESNKTPTHCQFRLFNDLTVETANQLDLIASPRARSAPTSRFPSPVVSPERSNTGELRVSNVGNVRSPDYSPLHSPASRSPLIDPKIPKRFSFPLHHKEWPECSNQVNAHPLPLPPGPSPSQSQPVVHHMTEKPNVSMGKGQWRKGKLIGRGTFGSVYIGTHRETGASCAIKEVDIVPDDPKSAECIKQLEQEIRVLQNLKHPNIVQYYGSEIVDDHFYIYLEYVHPGSISKYVREHCGDMTESIVRNFTRHILSGLAYLHSTKTIHRDIKGANLLVNSSGTVKLADFGMAKHLTGLSYELSLKGSPHWMAPEVIKAVMRKDADPDLALAVDIWSLGCTIIEMYTGKPPWGDIHGPAAMFRVLHKIPPIPETMSADGKDFLSCCLRRNPAERRSALMLLEHPFVGNSNDLKISACTRALSSINFMDKPKNSGDCTAEKTDVASSSGKRIVNGKLPNNSKTNHQTQDKTFNYASASYHSFSSASEGLPYLSRIQPAHGSHNFSSSPNVAGNMQLNSEQPSIITSK